MVRSITAVVRYKVQGVHSSMFNYYFTNIPWDLEPRYITSAITGTASSMKQSAPKCAGTRQCKATTGSFEFTAVTRWRFSGGITSKVAESGA